MCMGMCCSSMRCVWGYAHLSVAIPSITGNNSCFTCICEPTNSESSSHLAGGQQGGQRRGARLEAFQAHFRAELVLQLEHLHLHPRCTVNVLSTALGSPL